MALPLVSIVIPHHNGKEILFDCLSSLEKTDYPTREVIVVNNASTDGSVEKAQKKFPWICVVENQSNLGYAGGCNSGLEKAGGKYALFLNNDTVFGPDWLKIIVEVCEENEQIAACQPKILSLANRRQFDYSGAAGGLIDRFGYPFAKGRLFFTNEIDNHQYDDGGDIFWASGTALLVRKTALDEVGHFDEDFFAHMEEIDLNWRFHLAGYRVVSVPKAVVYHNSGSTLKPDSPKKIFLNHRNSLIMLLKNYQLKNLIWILPIRIFLEIMTMVYCLIKLDFVRMKAVPAAFINILMNLKKIVSKRKHVAGIRKLPDSEIFQKMYRGSIVFEYFIGGVRKASDLKFVCKN